MSAIFISHSSKDNAWAERIAAWLRDEPRQRPAEHRYDSLFLDVDPEDGIQLGQLWRDTLYEKLQLCVAVIVICSEAYAASQWCLAELGIAMARGALVLPVRIDASPLPKLLSETQATKLTVIDLEQGSDAGWERLLKGLEPLSWQSRLPWPPPEEPGASPFPGLLCFERWHAPVFFGQDAVRQLVQDTIRELPQRQSRLSADPGRIGLWQVLTASGRDGALAGGGRPPPLDRAGTVPAGQETVRLAAPDACGGLQGPGRDRSQRTGAHSGADE